MGLNIALGGAGSFLVLAPLYNKQEVKMNDVELNKEGLLYWLSWLRGQAKEAKIWSGVNDEVAYEQVKQLIEKVPEEDLITRFKDNPTRWMKYLGIDRR